LLVKERVARDSRPIMLKVAVSRSKRILAGHPWIFANELAQSPKGFEPGSLVEVVDRRNTFLGIGYINPASLIAVRLLTRRREAIDKKFFRERIAAALARRERWFGNRCSYRMVFSEADGLPGLTIDRYSDCLVVQLSTAGMEAQRQPILEACGELLDPRAIVLRNDSNARVLEGLPQVKEMAKGVAEPLPEVEEDGVLFAVDLFRGQKTGLFLDQRDNRARVRPLAAGRRVLNAFAYSGGFAIAAALGGAAHVVSVDTSRPALELAEAAWAENGLDPERATWIEGDVFDWLREPGEPFDLVVLDPPPFVRRRRDLTSGLRGYKDVNLQALRRLAPGGWLLTCSCSQHLDRAGFRQVVAAAAADAGRALQLVAEHGHPADHPTALAHPEGEYLKALLVRG
jgi:23S rRNA (cytosine1962-C5)-methyltransferase